MDELRTVRQRKRLFVGQGNDGIVTRCAQSRIEGSRRGTRQREPNRGKNPIWSNQHGEAGTGFLQNSLRHEGQKNSHDGTDQRDDQRLAEQHAYDGKPRKSQGFQDTDFARALHHHGVHVEQHHQKADDNAEPHHRARKGFQLWKIRRGHQRNILRKRAHAALWQELQDLRARAIRIALAAYVEHGDALLRAGNLLRCADGNEETRTLAVRHDSTDGKGVIEQGDVASNLQVPLLRHDVVSDGLVWRVERLARAIEKAAAEAIEALVGNTVDHHQAFWLGKNFRGRDLVNARQSGNLLPHASLHHGAGKSEKNRSVGRLYQNIRAHAFGALAPFGKHSRGETYNHQYQYDLDGDGHHAQRTAQWASDEAADEHLHERKRTVECFIHGKFFVTLTFCCV